jgi:hypothetical protein
MKYKIKYQKEFKKKEAEVLITREDLKKMQEMFNKDVNGLIVYLERVK